MIGVFDSGLGGVCSLRYFQEKLPEADRCYLADNAYLPYGEKTPAWTQIRTFEALNRLFDQGCVLVIIACNTAASAGIKQRQSLYPDKKVLSVTIPGVEAVKEADYATILLMATQQTIDSRVFPQIATRWELTSQFTDCPGGDLVGLIEDGATDEQLSTYTHQLLQPYQTSSYDAVLLGCTHYPEIEQYISDIFPQAQIINPASEAASKLPDYLLHHPEIGEKITHGGAITFFYTKKDTHFEQRSVSLFGINHTYSLITI